MKATLKKIVFFIMLIISAVGIARADSIDLIVQKAPNEPIEEDPIENRAPARPLLCTISEEGIFVQGININEFISYEAYDIDGNCLIACGDPLEFSSYVLSISENIEIRIITHNYILKGYLIF